ncbi:hypothetical protein EOI86_11170 [Hwanghaeella grinnelliae]|uniref:ATP synthase subunit b n=1 Tax=Hwanghaeella grinnelliae TaxID=2500179 RepID=A0A3S2Y1Z4_9PROT|nr:hypothetical protein [Hwanghaeella grinnelliae]RVU35822.1 hypothetical protein EOI86_11170 [Hwanghaeella grinnelliae]
MQIDWWTLALQAINFIILVWLLRRFLYAPIRDVIARRRAQSDEVLVKAAEKEAEAEALKQSLEEERAAMAQERRQMLKEVQDQAADARDKAMTKAHDDARNMIDEARQALVKEREETLRGMKQEIGALAASMAAEILTKTDTGALANACLEQLGAKLTALGEPERAQLRDDAAKGSTGKTSGGGIHVATAEPIPPGDQGRWCTMLSGHLGNLDDFGGVVFETDPELIGGAELRFPHTVLKFSWADRLERARRMLQSDDAAS